MGAHASRAQGDRGRKVTPTFAVSPPETTGPFCLEEELCEALSRPRYGRRKSGEDAAASVVGVRHGHRERTLTGTFGETRIAVPRARLMGDDGKTREWRSGSLRAYQRRTRAADALIAGAYLSGTNTRRVRRALAAAFAGPVGKDVVSRTWRKVKGDWDTWNGRCQPPFWHENSDAMNSIA